MSNEIHKVRVRKSLEPRREPYWGPAIADDLAIGYRKIDGDRGTWIARRRNDDHLAGSRSPGAAPPRYLYETLGAVTDDNDYEVARSAALKWREMRDAGVSGDEATVSDACREYVEDRRREKGEDTAHDAEKRFERTVYGTSFGATKLAKLRTPTIKAWRDGLDIGKPSRDRTLTALKAALNLSVLNRRVHAGLIIEWKSVKPYGPKAGKPRDLFLDLDQRRALRDAAEGAERNLIEGVALTGARAGELVKARRSQFDARTRSMTFIGKTGKRTVPLSDAGVTFFARLAESKLPAAFLFTRADGKPWAHSDWDELIRAAGAAANLPRGVCLYTLRHSFITTALLEGMPTLEVARMVGTSVAMIEKHYGHLVANRARERLSAVQML